MKCVVFFYFEPLFFAQNNDQEIFVAHLIVFSGRNQMYTSLKHGHKQGSHRNSHREIPARYEDVGGNHKQVKVTRISTEYVFRCLNTPCTKSMSQGSEDLGWTKNLCLSNLIGTGKESSYWHISQTEDKFRYCYVHCAVSVILECTWFFLVSLTLQIYGSNWLMHVIAIFGFMRNSPLMYSSEWYFIHKDES